MARKTTTIFIQVVKVIRQVTKHPGLVLGVALYLAPTSPHLHLGECVYLGRAGMTELRGSRCSTLMMIKAPRTDQVILNFKERF